MKVFKYEFHGKVRNILMDQNAIPIKAGIQRTLPCLWVLTSEFNKETQTERTFRIFATGEEGIKAEDRYVGTFFTDNNESLELGDKFVWHVFEIIR